MIEVFQFFPSLKNSELGLSTATPLDDDGAVRWLEFRIQLAVIIIRSLVFIT